MRDNNGDKLMAQQKYNWDGSNECFVGHVDGYFDENDIKLLRIMASTDLSVASRVKNTGASLDKVWQLMREVVHI